MNDVPSTNDVQPVEPQELPPPPPQFDASAWWVVLQQVSSNPYGVAMIDVLRNLIGEWHSELFSACGRAHGLGPWPPETLRVLMEMGELIDLFTESLAVHEARDHSKH